MEVKVDSTSDPGKERQRNQTPRSVEADVSLV